MTAAAASPATDYTTWTVAELQDELARRGLPTDGLKADLVDRLTQADG